jgi:hypothetical protein
MGNGGHHGALDYGGVNRLRVPRNRLPQVFVDWTEELGLGWWVEREYPHEPRDTEGTSGPPNP